jgi:hypothetical protein
MDFFFFWGFEPLKRPQLLQKKSISEEMPGFSFFPQKDYSCCGIALNDHAVE